MSDPHGKILIIADRSGSIREIKSISPKHYTLTIMKTLREAIARASLKEYDFIMAEPDILEEFRTSFDRSDKEKQEVLDEVRNAIQGLDVVVLKKKDTSVDIQNKYESIQTMLKRMSENLEKEKDALESEVRQLRSAAQNGAQLRKYLAIVREDLTKAISLAESAIQEKTEAEGKLAEVQKTWEEYIGVR